MGCIVRFRTIWSVGSEVISTVNLVLFTRHLCLALGRLMDNLKIEVINYLDMNANTDNKQIETFSISKLKEAFPDLDEFSLKKIESEWRKARQRMLNLRFAG